MTSNTTIQSVRQARDAFAQILRVLRTRPRTHCWARVAAMCERVIARGRCARHPRGDHQSGRDERLKRARAVNVRRTGVRGKDAAARLVWWVVVVGGGGHWAGPGRLILHVREDQM